LHDEQITFGEDVDFNIRANVSLNWLTILPLVKYVMYSENQITNSSIKNKVIPNFNSFEILAKFNLKIFDFHHIFLKNVQN
jgi:hypothetical protein